MSMKEQVLSQISALKNSKNCHRTKLCLQKFSPPGPFLGSRSGEGSCSRASSKKGFGARTQSFPGGFAPVGNLRKKLLLPTLTLLLSLLLSPLLHAGEGSELLIAFGESLSKRMHWLSGSKEINAEVLSSYFRPAFEMEWPRWQAQLEGVLTAERLSRLHQSWANMAELAEKDPLQAELRYPMKIQELSSKLWFREALKEKKGLITRPTREESLTDTTMSAEVEEGLIPRKRPGSSSPGSTGGPTHSVIPRGRSPRRESLRITDTSDPQLRATLSRFHERNQTSQLGMSDADFHSLRGELFEGESLKREYVGMEGYAAFTQAHPSLNGNMQRAFVQVSAVCSGEEKEELGWTSFLGALSHYRTIRSFVEGQSQEERYLGERGLGAFIKEELKVPYRRGRGMISAALTQEELNALRWPIKKRKKF